MIKPAEIQANRAMIKPAKQLADSDVCGDPVSASVFANLQHPQQLEKQIFFEEFLCEKNLGTNSIIAQDRSKKQLQMEQCINLDLYLTPIMDDNVSKLCTDELNTPNILFDAEATNELNKIINSTQQLEVENPFNFPVAREERSGVSLITALDNLNELNDNIQNLIGGSAARRNQDANMLSNSNSNSNGNGNDTNAEGVATHEGSLLLTSNNYSLADLDDINLDEYDLLTDYRDAILNDKLLSSISAPTVTLATPPIDHHNYALKLNFDNSKFIFGDEIQTPDIINTICSIENEYNLTGQVITPEEIKLEIPETEEETNTQIPFCPDDTSNLSTATTVSSIQSATKKSKRKKPDSDDEYIPPSKRRSSRASTSFHIEDSSDEDYVPEPKKAKRGRPAKPISSSVSSNVSSNSSNNSVECSKYREMRDKNNEASRKSRRKRRDQELVHERECEELSYKNERLRVEVAELEKTVNTFRNNLMQLLLSK